MLSAFYSNFTLSAGVQGLAIKQNMILCDKSKYEKGNIMIGFLQAMYIYSYIGLLKDRGKGNVTQNSIFLPIQDFYEGSLKIHRLYREYRIPFLAPASHEIFPRCAIVYLNNQILLIDFRET